MILVNFVAMEYEDTGVYQGREGITTLIFYQQNTHRNIIEI